MSHTTDTLESLLAPRLSEAAFRFWQKSRDELSAGTNASRFSALISLASRHARRQPLGLSQGEKDAVGQLAEGLDLSAWNLLELLRVALICARPDLDGESFAQDFEAQFRYADEGETCALYRALPLLPKAERFVWRAGEGCRTNMLNVFSAVALDSPFPSQYFDDTAWNQLVMKSLFLELPLWRVYGLDRRRSAELTRMVLDFAEERRSAGRELSPSLWLCLGPQDRERSTALAQQAWAGACPRRRAAIVLGLARCDLLAEAEQLAGGDTNPLLTRALTAARSGPIDNLRFAELTADNLERQP